MSLLESEQGIGPGGGGSSFIDTPRPAAAAGIRPRPTQADCGTAKEVWCSIGQRVNPLPSSCWALGAK